MDGTGLICFTLFALAATGLFLVQRAPPDEDGAFGLFDTIMLAVIMLGSVIANTPVGNGLIGFGVLTVIGAYLGPLGPHKKWEAPVRRAAIVGYALMTAIPLVFFILLLRKALGL